MAVASQEVVGAKGEILLSPSHNCLLGEEKYRKESGLVWMLNGGEIEPPEWS